MKYCCSLGWQGSYPSTKQLADIKYEEEKNEEKLRKLEQTGENKQRTASSVVPHTTADPAAKKQKLH